jgi:hypothetical protein
VWVFVPVPVVFGFAKFSPLCRSHITSRSIKGTKSESRGGRRGGDVNSASTTTRNRSASTRPSVRSYR